MRCSGCAEAVSIIGIQTLVMSITVGEAKSVIKRSSEPCDLSVSKQQRVFMIKSCTVPVDCATTGFAYAALFSQPIKMNVLIYNSFNFKNDLGSKVKGKRCQG